MIKQIFISATGKDLIISAYIAEIMQPAIFIILNFIIDDINIETTISMDPIYPKISIKMELSIIHYTTLS